MSTVISAGNATTGLSFTPDNAGTFEFKTGTGSGTTAISVDASQATTFAAGVSGTTGSFSGNLSFNSGYGSAAVAYGCRAWVNFNGTGVVAIRASGNVTSITDNGTGDYTVNFTTAMPDANYSATHGQGPRSVAPFCSVCVSNTSSTYSFQTINTITGAVADASIAFVAVFR